MSLPEFETDLWQYLARTDKPIVMYGMGNGADKILAVCEHFGITVRDFFASDGFVRGHCFHGKQVMHYADMVEKYGAGQFIVLLSFASSLPDVMANFYRIASETELYAPDVPVCGNSLFDLAFYRRHLAELEEADRLLSDEESHRVFREVLSYKISGDIRHLRAAESNPAEVMRHILTPDRYRAYADLGAYNGDTIRALLPHALALKKVYAMEPDRRNFRKLEAYAAEETRCRVQCFAAGAWSHKDVLPFDASGNRNAGLHGKSAKTVDTEVNSLDNILSGAPVDFIKYDVEGAEREALIGSEQTIAQHRPQLLLSVYHRSEDLYALPLQLHRMRPDYRLYLRRFPYVPAWDLNLYAV
ncbi:MAG: FkbM family methyltransferase [Clostridia bacterium]|nr:FkbM family methyltransferase [Clostridia bacterium]